MRLRFTGVGMKVSLRRTIAITAAYAVAVHGLLALSVFAVHVAAATDRTGFALCTGAGSGAGDHGALPGKDQAHCLALCLAAADAVGCGPDGRACPTGIASVAARALSSAAEALPWAVAVTQANRPRAPPA